MEQIKSWEETELSYLQRKAELAKEEFGDEFSMHEFLKEN